MARYTISRDALYDALDTAALDYDAIRTDYSGRGMYGKECFGIVVDTIGEAFAFAHALGVNDEEGKVGNWIGDAQQDSMGLSTIVYWPSVQIEEVAAQRER